MNALGTNIITPHFLSHSHYLINVTVSIRH